MTLTRDATLRTLARQRLALVQKLAHVSRRAGPQHPDRSRENRRRAKLRRDLRAQLKSNTDTMVAHVMLLFTSIIEDLA